jgi:hypothetical protein
MAAQLFPGARQVLLVPDFCDMVASTLAFSAKRGRAGFDRRPGRPSRMVEVVASRSSPSYAHRTVSDAEASIERWRGDLAAFRGRCMREARSPHSATDRRRHGGSR